MPHSDPKSGRGIRSKFMNMLEHKEILRIYFVSHALFPLNIIV